MSFCDLTLALTLFSMTFVLMYLVPSKDIYQHLGEFELYASRLTDPTVQNMKALHFDFDMTLTSHIALILNVKHGLGAS